MKKILSFLFDGMKVAKFIRLVKLDMYGYKGPAYVDRLIGSILAHKSALPTSLTAKYEAEITAALVELTELPLSQLEGIVRGCLK